MAEIVHQPPVTVIELGDSYDALDVARHEQIQRLLLEQSKAADPPLVLLDFSRTSYFGSSFIELLFRAWKRLRDRGGQLAVCGLSPFCREVHHAARLDDLWAVYDSRKTAVAAMSTTV